MSPRWTTKQYERRVEEKYGPVVGFYTLRAAGVYAGMDEWPNIILPIRRELLTWAQNDEKYEGGGLRYYVHPHDIARVLHLTGRLSEPDAVDYARRVDCAAGLEDCLVEFDANDGDYIEYSKSQAS